MDLANPGMPIFSLKCEGKAVRSLTCKCTSGLDQDLKKMGIDSDQHMYKQGDRIMDSEVSVPGVRHDRERGGPLHKTYEGMKEIRGF
jgi:hypothetical protein